MTVTAVVAVFGWGFLLTGISAASTNVSVSKSSAQNGQGTTVAPADEKCGTVVHGNYYAGTNKEIKAILQGIQVQLSEMQDQLREIKIFNKTGEKKRSVLRSSNKYREVNTHYSMYTSFSNLCQ